MSVQKGATAPNIKLFTDEMKPFDLEAHRGKNVLLLFYPGAFTSVCTTELNDVNNELDVYEGHNTQVVGISTDSPFVQAEFKKANAINFPLLSDHNAAASAAYGSKYNNDFTPMALDRISKRSAFVIDADGVVQYAEVLENAGKQPDFDAIKATIANLNG